MAHPHVTSLCAGAVGITTTGSGAPARSSPKRRACQQAAPVGMSPLRPQAADTRGSAPTPDARAPASSQDARGQASYCTAMIS